MVGWWSTAAESTENEKLSVQIRVLFLKKIFRLFFRVPTLLYCLYYVHEKLFF